MKTSRQRLNEHLEFLYGERQASHLTERIGGILERFKARRPDLATSDARERVTQADAVLITYGDMLQHEGQTPLQSLAEFADQYLADVISAVHILPFFPYSSDDGFAVVDYKQVDPRLGGWEDIQRLGRNFRLMFDAVINHVSTQSAWFQGFLKCDPRLKDYFTVIESGADLSQVFRPRATPLLTPFETACGEKLVWTTFSADQVDLNYANPEVLIEAIRILLFYVAHGAEFIRLDAVTFVWKEAGSSCVNLPQTHRIVQLLRTVLDMAAPSVALITETNVPHKDNIAYFGNGVNEAQMVYNFALPILTLHAFHSQDARTLSEWIETLELPSPQATFFNFLASHDGIGMTPARDILEAQDLERLAQRTLALGGFVSYKSNPDGTQSAYELNVNYLDALGDPGAPSEAVELVARRFLASQAIMLALRGVPGIYFHSLFGSRNWRAGVKQTGRYRTINRQKLQCRQLETELADTGSLRCLVFNGLRRMLAARKASPAFHPSGGQRALEVHKAVLALLRSSPGGENQVLCLHNASNQGLELAIELQGRPIGEAGGLRDVLGGGVYALENGCLRLELEPYGVRWLAR